MVVAFVASRSLKVVALVLVLTLGLALVQWWRENKDIEYGKTAGVARTVIVGDCHGCASALRALLRKVGVQRGRDRVVLVGDLVGKGPEPHEVIRAAREVGALAVRGNHEERLLRWWRAGKPQAGAASLKRSYAATVASLDESHWRWLDALPVWLSFPELRVHPARWAASAGGVGASSGSGGAGTRGNGNSGGGGSNVDQDRSKYRGEIAGEGQNGGGVLVVHAGLPNPGAIESLWGAGARDRANGAGGLAAAMSLQDRNMLLNMRSLDETGHPNTKAKGMPWARQWRGPATIVFGHDARRGLQIEEHAVGLDSGCVYGGRLTALVVEAVPDSLGGEHRSTLVDVDCHKDWTGRAKKWKRKRKKNQSQKSF